MTHNFLITICVIVILLIQLNYFISLWRKISKYRDLFIYRKIDYEQENDEVIGIRMTDAKSETTKSILDQINQYLSKNVGRANDFYLIKDIVDRKCDSIEDEIETQVPMPLYLGLMGTMIGVLLGIYELISSRGLSSLLSGGDSSEAASGVGSLLSGVALAMIASFFGVLLTTLGASILKKTKVKVEDNRNNFLSWIQAELLPNLSSGLSQVLDKMTDNLLKFNKTFSQNTDELRDILSTVNVTYESNVEVLEAINSLNIKKLAMTNVMVFDKLESCTDDLERFSNYMFSVNEYLSNVRSLNDKLDENENRTKLIEELADYFKKERSNFNNWNSGVTKAVVEVSHELEKSVYNLKDFADNQMNTYLSTLIETHKVFLDSLDKVREREVALITKSSHDFETIVKEIKGIADIKEVLVEFIKQSKEQKQELVNLTNSIKSIEKIRVEVVDEVKKKSRKKESPLESINGDKGIEVQREKKTNKFKEWFKNIFKM